MKRLGSRNVWGRMFDSFRAGVAIDLGTASIRMMTTGGFQLAEPSCHAINRSTGGVVGWGEAAVRLLERDGAAIQIGRPVESGAMADYTASTAILKDLLARAAARRGGKVMGMRMAIAIPPQLTRVERTATLDACRQAGAGQMLAVQSVVAAAAGAEIPLHEVAGHMVVEAGAGRCSAAVFSRYQPVALRSERFGSETIDVALGDLLRNQHQIWVGSQTVRRAKDQYASIAALEEGTLIGLRGMDMLTNLPRSVEVDRTVLREIAWPVVRRLCGLTAGALSELPPELAGDVLLNGITLTGGMARLQGLPEELQRFTGCPVRVAHEPELAVVRGMNQILQRLDSLGPALGDQVASSQV